MDEAVSHFGEWLNLPDGSTFELLRDETDQLGIRHLRYRQYVRGYEVQASMVMVHGRDGIVTSANGVVMEQTAQPKTGTKTLASSSTTEKLYLVETPTGYRYATLHYDAVQNANVYTDAETGEVLKSVPLSHSISEKTMQGRSLYSGTVPITVTTLEDGQRAMADETRHIYTVDAHKAKGDKKDYIYGLDKDGKTIYDRERYINEQCSRFATDETFWHRSQLVEVTLQQIKTQQDDPFAEVYLKLCDYRGAVIGVSDCVSVYALPFCLKLTASAESLRS